MALLVAVDRIKFCANADVHPQTSLVLGHPVSGACQLLSAAARAAGAAVGWSFTPAHGHAVLLNTAVLGSPDAGTGAAAFRAGEHDTFRLDGCGAGRTGGPA